LILRRSYFLVTLNLLLTRYTQLFRPSVPDSGSEQEIFHQRVTELGQLAANIALDLRGGIHPRLEQAQFRLDSLNEWHRALPAAMQLSRLNQADPQSIPLFTKRRLLHLHMLFLGLFNEPYRACLVNLGKSRSGVPTSQWDDLRILTHIEKQCVSAAQQCARVVSLLQLDNLIRSHCWVALYVNGVGKLI
jgi:hypothetical protein